MTHLLILKVPGLPGGPVLTGLAGTSEGAGEPFTELARRTSLGDLLIGQLAPWLFSLNLVHISCPALCLSQTRVPTVLAL